MMRIINSKKDRIQKGRTENLMWVKQFPSDMMWSKTSRNDPDVLSYWRFLFIHALLWQTLSLDVTSTFFFFNSLSFLIYRLELLLKTRNQKTGMKMKQRPAEELLHKQDLLVLVTSVMCTDPPTRCPPIGYSCYRVEGQRRTTSCCFFI